jgi:hypothetical protein
MTVSEAMNAVDQALDGLRLKDIWGVDALSAESAGVLSAYFPKEWDENLELFYTGLMKPEEYVQKQMAMIENFDRDRFRKRIEKRLADLGQDQRELA